MGRPYANELDELDDTYRWSVTAPIDQLADTLIESAGRSLLAIGSGGSLTAAHFACLLHTRFTGCLAQVLTPYELMRTSHVLSDSSVLVCSAGGGNPDVLACVANAAYRLPRQLFALTMRRSSPLSRLLAGYGWPRCHAFAAPTRKDGFLATNSLLATIVLLTRGYEAAFNSTPLLPDSLPELLHPRTTRDEFLRATDHALSPLLRRSTLIVLHGANTKPAAMDIESRMTEAALCQVQLADFRNFAHGRHHWLAVHANSSAVLSLSSAADEEVAQRTLALIPKSIPKCGISVEEDFAGALSAVCRSLFIARIAGVSKGVDPGRPHVPQFGRKLYHLRARPEAVSPEIKINERAAAAIERKAGLSLETLALRRELDRWTAAYGEFLERLGEARIKTVVLDYDGTLCPVDRRFEGPAEDVIEKLKALLASGTHIAIATGRGKSVREALQQRIRSKEMRARIIIGYHNAGEIGDLNQSACPPEKLPLHESLIEFVDRVKTQPVLLRDARVQAKGRQVTFELCRQADSTRVFDLAASIARMSKQLGLSVVTSTHSIDVLAPGVSKRLLIDHLKEVGAATGDTSVLCVGDRGRWPGNDAELLTHPLSLSVDQVSSDPGTCWNLSSDANRFDRACLEYLDLLILGKSGARFNVKRLKP